jgi:hypothetical protein
MKQFAARLRLATSAGPDRLRMRVYVPPDLLERAGPIRMEIDDDGEPAAPVILDTAGYQEIVRRFRWHGHRSVIASFRLDKALPPDDRDPRERGVVMVAIDCE